MDSKEFQIVKMEGNIMNSSYQNNFQQVKENDALTTNSKDITRSAFLNQNFEYQDKVKHIEINRENFDNDMV